MRTLPAILTGLRAAASAEPSDLLVEACRVLASYADPERAGSGHVTVLTEQIIEAYQARQYTARMEAAGLVVEHGEEMG